MGALVAVRVAGGRLAAYQDLDLACGRRGATERGCHSNDNQLAEMAVACREGSIPPW